MTDFFKHSAAAIVAVVIVAATWIPVISVPPAQASALISLPILA